MDINIGKILIQPKDNWNATTPYAYLNLVRYNKKLYICKSVTGAPAGTLPTNTSYYMETTQDGIDAQEIQLQKTATEIQWKRTGETTWTTLVALSAIKGDTGAKGDTGLKGDKGDTGLKGDKGDAAPNTIWQYKTEGGEWTTDATGAVYERQSGDNGITWSAAHEYPGVAAQTAKTASEASEAARDVAVSSKNDAVTARTGAETARQGAETARARAERAEGAAALSERNAKISEDAAEFAASEAAASEVSARNYLNMITDIGSSLPEAIMQNNLNVNSSFDRIEVTEAELVDIEKVVLNAELSTRMSAMRAAQSETNARISASESAAAKTAAEFARNESQSARNDSQAARNDSRIAKAAAETAAGNAASSETAAQRAQAGAGTAQTGAETARTGAETARASAERAEGAAEAARDAASVSEANAQRTYFNVAQLALQLGNPLLELENQNTLAEAILQENMLINNIYDRLEGGIYAAI